MRTEDWEPIADLLFDAKKEAKTTGELNVLRHLVFALCDWFQKTSTNFDRQRFLAACGQ